MSAIAASRRSAPFRDSHAAVRPIDHERESVADTELDRDVAELDGRPDRGHVRCDRDEDLVGDREDRLVQPAVRRVQVDDDESKPRRAALIASVTRSGSRMSVSQW